MNDTLGDVIARHRMEKEMSQRDLAIAVKVSNSTIARIERGESIVPGNDTLRAIAQTLDLDYYYLLALCKQIDDEPEIRMIQRAAHNMTQEQKEDMIRILQISFKDAFTKAGNDEGN